jgi:hypothetical protein
MPFESRWSRACGPVVAAGVVLALGAADASAADRPIGEALDLEAGRCLRADDLAARMARWLRRDAVDEALDVAVAETATGARFVLRRGGTVLGERTLALGRGSCEDTAEAVALAIASAIDVAPEAESDPPLAEA